MADDQDTVKPAYFPGFRVTHRSIFVQDVGEIPVLVRPTAGQPRVMVENDNGLDGEIRLSRVSMGSVVQLFGEVRTARTNHKVDQDRAPRLVRLKSTKSASRQY